MNDNKLLLLSLIILLFTACRPDDEEPIIPDDPNDTKLEEVLQAASGGVGLDHFLLPASNDFSSIPQDPLNPLTDEKVALGQLLYHETGLAIAPMHEISRGTYSCASCHHAAAGFQAGRFQGISDGGWGFGQNGLDRQKAASYQADEIDVQPIRTPTTLNVAYQVNMLWNGQFGATGSNIGTEAYWKEDTPIETNFLGYEGVEVQAIAGLSVHRLDMDSTLLVSTVYQSLFDDVFKEIPTDERYGKEYMGQAIAAYERTLLPNEAPFQKWLQGNKEALSEQEKLGAILFFGKANCGSCHNGPALNDMAFHAIGMANLDDCPEEVFKTPSDDPAHLGRASFTGIAEDEYKFKTPQLYNLKDSPFFGHGGTFRTLRDVVVYKNQAIPQNSNVTSAKIDPLFQPLSLSEEEINQVTSFLRTALYDPNLTRYLPDALPSGNCFPVNDPQSRIDLGCE